MNDRANPARNALGDRAGPIPAFDGFPYLVTLVTKQLYHIAVLPKTLETLDAYREIAQQQVAANRLQSCLGLGTDQAIYVRLDGSERWSPTIPSGAIVVTGRLQLSRKFPDTAELADRVALLHRFLEEHAVTGYMLGDILKGGRPATPGEIKTLKGSQANGVPKGLERCADCMDWRGPCLDPGPTWAGLRMTVECRCANDDRCAWCLVPLAEWKLGSNYYDESDGKIWHVPAFMALDHRCGGS